MLDFTLYETLHVVCHLYGLLAVTGAELKNIYYLEIKSMDS